MADEFDEGTMPNPEIWNIRTGYGDNGWGNNEWQLYTDSPDNVRIEDGNLVITALCDPPCGERDDSVTSARIATEDKFEQAYGRFEARIKVPEGRGLWPAFWMLGGNFAEVDWPECGEIDIMEWLGRNPDVAVGTLHGPGFSGAQSLFRETELEDGSAFSDDFHVFSVDWDPGQIIFRVDGEKYVTRSTEQVAQRGRWVFNQPFFMILNLAVGGTLGGPVDPAAFPAELLVDYVRVYERAQ
jgi:beta-glucanase (GH16 family)